jgi:hypothetical protein
MAEAFHGMSALLEGLRRLPTAVEREASWHVHEAADTMAAEVRNEYAVVTGKLQSGVKVQRVNAFRAVVKSTARHAALYERGTVARHHASGKSVGAMPKANVFIPAAIKARAAMVEALIRVVAQQTVPGMTGRLDVTESGRD